MGGQRHAPAAFTPRKDPVSIVQKAGWAPGAGLDGCGKPPHPPVGFDPRTEQPVASRYYPVPSVCKTRKYRLNTVEVLLNAAAPYTEDIRAYGVRPLATIRSAS